MINTQELQLKINGSTILDKVSIEVPENKVTALIGPNGAGKSTLLHTIARLTTQDSGTVLLDNQSITEYDDKELARRLSILKQESIIGSRLQVRDLVGFGTYPHNLGRLSESDHQTIDKSLEDLKLTPLEHRFLDTLSGGQRQRAFLAMIFAQNTETVLLDEPLNNLDLSHARHLMRTIKDYSKRGKTFIVVLHDLNYAARYADHIIAMKQGEVFANGSTKEIFNADLLSELYETPIEIVHVNDAPIALTF